MVVGADCTLSYEGYCLKLFQFSPRIIEPLAFLSCRRGNSALSTEVSYLHNGLLSSLFHYLLLSGLGGKLHLGQLSFSASLMCGYAVFDVKRESVPYMV